MTTKRTYNRPGKALLAVALAASLLAAPAMPAQATFPGKDGKIAFVSSMTEGEGVDNPERDSEIFTINPDGSGLKQLTRNDDFDDAPAFSPDGKLIVFEGERGGNEVDIIVMRADGTRQKNLTKTPNVEEGAPAWSPNGRQIAFDSDRGDSGKDIFVMRADGTRQKNLTEGADGFDVNPNWSPDGKRIAFQSDRDSGNGFDDDIFVMRADGSNPKNLTETPVDFDFAPNWSPDGKLLTFSSEQDSDPDIDPRTFDIFTIEADGSSSPKNLTDTPDEQEFFSVFSPNGKRIAFKSDREGGFRNDDIFVMKADGSNQKKITDFPGVSGVSELDWQPKKK